jgi:hypothetical protein
MEGEELMREVDPNEFWQTVEGIARKEAEAAAGPSFSLAITTGDSAVTVTSGSVTTYTVACWIDGDPQDAAHKRPVTLLYGATAPGPNQRWLVAWPNHDQSAPGVLLARIG